MEVIILERDLINVVMKHVRFFGFNQRNELAARHSFMHMTVLTDSESSKLDPSVLEKIMKNNNKPVKIKITGLAVYTHGTQEIYLALEAEGLEQFRRTLNLQDIDQHVTIGHMWINKYYSHFESKVAEWLNQEQERLVKQMDRLAVETKK